MFPKISNLQEFLQLLRKERELVDIEVEVDPHLEAAEIHRRVIASNGPALLFRRIKGSPFPVVTNLFGTNRRMNLAFSPRPEELIKKLTTLVTEFFPPSPAKLWDNKGLLWELTKIGTKSVSSGGVLEVREDRPDLTKLPLLTTWEEDGGAFFTLPLVYTEHPELGIHNLGVYRMQRYDSVTTGFHAQIGKGAGYHLQAAAEKGRKLPVNVFIGGHPALILAAVAPLPENVPELLLASFVMGEKVRMVERAKGELPILADAEFVLCGEVDPNESRPEGPFGDHYGYYSLTHDFPVFRCKQIYRKRNPVLTATVVGKPRQEDFFIGDYLQELLKPIFPLVMPAVKDLWAYGETGYHSLAAAVVQQRYKREAMVSAFRILGEGQLALTKFLLLIDKALDLKNFRSVLEHVLERADFRTDLYIFSNLSMDTLDYNGPRINEGSKGVLLGVGDKIRELPVEFRGDLPPTISKAVPFCSGCLVVEGRGDFVEAIKSAPSMTAWPLIILTDNAAQAAKDAESFLWTTFTRFEPGAHIFARERRLVENHVSYEMPIIIDARLRPDFPKELECDTRTAALVSRRWREYFPTV